MDALTSAEHAASPFGEAHAQVCLGAFEGWNEAENNSNSQRNSKGIQQNGRVQAYVLDTGNASGRCREQSFNTPLGEGQADESADAGKLQTLGDELPHDLCAAGAQRQADSKFAGTCGGAGKQQIGNISGSDQQDQADGGQQQQNGAFDIAHQRFLQGDEVDSQAAFSGGVEIIDVQLNGVHFSEGLGDAHFGPEAANALNIVDGTITDVKWIAAGDGQVHISLAITETKLRLENADDRIVDSVQGDIFAEGRGIAGKAVLPEAGADDCGGCAAGLVLLGRQTAAEREAHPQCGKESRRDFLAVDMRGGPGAGEVEAAVRECREAVEGAGIALPVEKIGVRKIGGIAEVAVKQGYFDEAAGLGIGKRGEHDALEHAEYCGIGADTEGQGQDHGEGEAGTFSQGARGVAKVLEEPVKAVHGGMVHRRGYNKGK